MLVPLTWLKEYVDLMLPVQTLADRLSLAGLEVEEIKRQGDWWDPATILVGRVVSVKQHPNADRLTLVEVDYGAGTEQVVTGAPNLFAYKDADQLPVLKVAFARNGAVLIDAYSEETPRPRKKLKASKIRGIPSNGMVCSERELGLSDEHEGILLLPEDAPVGTPLRDYLGNEVFEIGLTPDMARCLSMTGVAREVAALTGAPLRLPPDETASSAADENEAANYARIEIANPELCNRYIGLVIKNVTIGPSPRWMQEHLTLAGMRPINNVVDITNFVMLEWGQPLHAFDYDRLLQRARQAGQEVPVITVRAAHAGEKMTTLDGVARDLDESMLMITDGLGSIAVAGVMGGSATEVNDETRTIFLEAATFDNINNRRTAQKLKLHSEASHRFSHGIPATLNPIAARRAATLMSAYAGSTVVPGAIDTYPVPQAERVVYTTASDVCRLLGMEVDLASIAQHLRRLDIACEILPELPASATGQEIFGLQIVPGEAVARCTAPWHRLDIQVPADLAEEVARVIGYEDIATTLMSDVLPPAHPNDTPRVEEQIRDILTGCGLMETINYALTTPENHAKLLRANPAHIEQNTQFVTLLNPLNVNRRVMRRSLLVSALENAAYNYRYAQRLASFEIGRVYLPEQGDGKLPLEEHRLSILLTGPRRPASLHADPAGAEPFDFFDVKGILEELFARLGLADDGVEYVAREQHPTFAATSAEIRINGTAQGVIGEVHPLVLQAFDLPTSARVYVADLALAPLVKPGWRLQPMRPISIYQPVIEDLAFVVGEEVPAAAVQAAIRQAGGALLGNIELFDVYRGQPIPAGHKSLAYQLTYQSLEGNLSESRVQDLRNRIIRRVSSAVGGSLRE